MTSAGATSVEPEQAAVPELQCLGLRELENVHQPRSPRGPGVPAELCPGPPTLKSSLQQAKDAGACGLEELREVPWAPWLLGVGFPAPASFLSVSPPVDDSVLPQALWEPGCVRGYWVTGKTSGDASLGCLFWHIPLGLTVQEQDFPSGCGCCLWNQSWAGRNAAAWWPFAVTSLKPVLLDSGSWWWTGRPGLLRFMGSQSPTRLSDWTERNGLLILTRSWGF